MNREVSCVETPFVAQLQSLGWSYVRGSLDNPRLTERSSFSDVIQECVLRECLYALNLGPDGKPWLDDARCSEAVAALSRLGVSRLMEANEKATGLLIKGVTVEGLPGWDGGRGKTVQYIDWDTPRNNRFTVVSQYRVDCLPGFDRGKRFIVPDLVLLVNGIPLVVVECKSPAIAEPLGQAIDQLRRYSNQRRAAFEVDNDEGNEALFATNQLLIATSFDVARVGCVGAAFEHYAQWKTVVGPHGFGTEIEVAKQLGKDKLSEQERLIAGMLAPENLLDIVRNFLIFTQVGGQTIKSVCRYQQYRAVNLAIARLKNGKTRRQQGEHDERGGIVWHTQGSGKSLTMVFLVRKLRTEAKLRRFKVIVVTDRKDLQSQLSATATLTGETVEVASSTTVLRKLLSRNGPGLIFATIQKYRETDLLDDAPLTAADLPRLGEPKRRYNSGHVTDEGFGVLNEDESVLVLVDEAHRTQAGGLHANLLAGLPNCARIGFTGTPIIMGEKKRTHEIFGEFIDRYTIREAEQDGATVPVLYEGRTAKGAVAQGADLDGLFDDMFCQSTPEELEAIRKKYATKGNIFEAPALIDEKARDMLRHYVTNILPNGYKAQVVAYSRLAVVRYFEALKRARDSLLKDITNLSPEMSSMDDESLCVQPFRVQALVQAWRYREVLARMKFAPIISGNNNDDPEWKDWTDSALQEEVIKKFKKPLYHPDSKKADPLAFIIVKSMLLTGFDAPIEGVMYLDRPIQGAELLQAIARVNRSGFGKRCGIVVDYYGVARHLKEALAAYADADVDGALASLKDELPVLRERHMRLEELFRPYGVISFGNDDACIDALANERLRADFSVKLKEFLVSLDTILPRPEGLPYVKDAKNLSYIYARARNRYKDIPEIGRDVGAKVRKLIDDYVVSLGVDPRIPPIQLTDASFDKHVSGASSDRAKASEMEHAIRSHIRRNLDQDPVLYRKLSERLDNILKELGEQWEEIVRQLQNMISGIRTGHVNGECMPDGLSDCYVPFLRTILAEVYGDQDINSEKLVRIQAVTVDLVDLLIFELKSNRRIWSPSKRADQDSLNAMLFEHLMQLSPPLVGDEKAGILADKLMEQARANHDRLVQV